MTPDSRPLKAWERMGSWVHICHRDVTVQILRFRCWDQHNLNPLPRIFGKGRIKNKPAAQAAGADPSR